MPETNSLDENKVSFKVTLNTNSIKVSFKDTLNIDSIKVSFKETLHDDSIWENPAFEDTLQVDSTLTDIFLNDTWNLYFHDPYDMNWNNSSYARLASIGSVDDFWKHHSSLKTNLHKGMFFIMRDGIFPSWDSTQNINGGCLSIKVLKEHMADFWEDLTIKMLGETLIKESHRNFWDCINGLSTSPKKNFCIIKIWVKDKIICSKDFLYILPKYHGDIIFKSNIEYITTENIARTTITNRTA